MPRVLEAAVDAGSRTYRGRCPNTTDCGVELEVKGDEFSTDFPGDDKNPIVKCPNCNRYITRNFFWDATEMMKMGL